MYYGEKGIFSYRENYCEQLDGTECTSKTVAEFGEKLNLNAKTVAVGYEDGSVKHYAYALAAGLSENGYGVFLPDDTPLAVFMHCVNILRADCGIFIHSGKLLKISLWDGMGMPVENFDFRNEECALTPSRFNAPSITSFPSLEQIYLNTLRCPPLKATVSCANRRIRRLWEMIFPHEGDIILQVSADGMNVTVYSENFGFINKDRLIMMYAYILLKKGENVALPEDFHFIAEEIAEKLGGNSKVIRNDRELLREQRFTYDMLYLASQLVCNNIQKLNEDIPQFYTAKREISAECENFGDDTVRQENGRICIKRSGKNRLTLIAEAYDTETASELCNNYQFPPNVRN